MDKRIYQLHRWLGLFAGIFILLLSLTGTWLVVAPVLETAAIPRLPTPGSAPRRNMDTLLLDLRQNYPDAVLMSLRLFPAQPDNPLQVEIRKDHEVMTAYLNPYSGKVLGDWHKKEGSFTHIALELHKKLLLGFFGEMLMGVVAICLLGSVITGLIHYRRSLLKVFTTGVRFRKGFAVANSDMHKLLGVTGLAFMLLMAGTGVFFHWEDLEHALEGEEDRPERPKVLVPPVLNFSLTDILAESQKKVPGFEPEIVQFPREPDGKLTLRGNTPGHNPLLGKFTTSIAFDIPSGKPAKVFHAEEADAEFKTEHLIEELHFGRYGGWLTQLLYGLGGLATGIMTISGFFIFRRS
jgi:uncharacterized iron-regulated membrane protein